MVILGQGHDPEEVVAQRYALGPYEPGRTTWTPTTGGVSTAMANNPAKLGVEEQLAPVSDDPDKDGQEEPAY